MAILSGILTGIIPLLTKGAESWLTSRQTQGERDFELAKIKAQAEAAANADALKAQAELARAEADIEVQRLKTIRDLQGKATGYKWIDASINLVRALFGYAAILIFIASGVNLWQIGSPLLTQAQFSEVFFAILFYFFAERSVKKAFGKD